MPNISQINGFGINAQTASLATTASFVTGSIFTGTNLARSASFALTASFALNAGGGSGFPFTGSAIITGSLVVTGSTTSTLGFTGSLFGTSSWAVSASQALTASFVQTAQTASYVLQAVSASFASTASFTPNALTTASVNLNTITFTKGDGSTFPITVDTGSGGGGGGSTAQGLSIYAIRSDFPIFIGDGKAYATIPSASNGLNLTDAQATTFVSSSSGNIQVQLARGRQSSPSSSHSYVDMLSTVITIDANEYDSINGATQRVINTSNDDVLAGDLIRVDVDASGSNALGLMVRLTFG